MNACRSDRLIDRRMIEIDGTPNKGQARLRTRFCRGVHGPCARAAAAALNASRSTKLSVARYSSDRSANTLPVPMMNILNGGAHADNSVDPQEFMVMPIGANSFREALRHARRGYSTT